MRLKTTARILRVDSAYSLARRSWLARAGALASSTVFPFGLSNALAQAEAPLASRPRRALVIGNSKYVRTPLANPANDARAVGKELAKLGFEVDLKLEVGRDEMVEAIRNFSIQLSKRKAVGLFYYAGHGAQLEWRNYLIPVDASIGSAADIQARAVDVGTLLKNLSVARNASNIIILDACRDNPFGEDVRMEQKGLSQLDAPPLTLLAYSTTPGNVATDGAGTNSLYTQNLLTEMRAPAERIEDVFKRVRLNVRRQSRGRQIPWESTSLEDDFYFSPPQHLRKRTEEELERQFAEENAAWEKIKDSTQARPFEEYLLKYPSGLFSEVAQFQLDRALARLGEQRIEIPDDTANPFTKGTVRANTRWRVGQRYRFREIDLYTKLETRSYTYRVTEVSETEVVFNDGTVAHDLLGNSRKQADGDRVTQSQVYIAEYAVGKRWSTRYKLVKPDGRTFFGEYELKVVGREPVTVPAGTFDAFHIEGKGWGEEARSELTMAYWLTPQIPRFVAREFTRRIRSGKITHSYRTELVSLTPQPKRS